MIDFEGSQGIWISPFPSFKYFCKYLQSNYKNLLMSALRVAIHIITQCELIFYLSDHYIRVGGF